MIVVTGGAGLIGSAFVWKCNQEGRSDIWIVDNLAKSDKWKNLVGLRFEDYLHKDKFLGLLLSGEFPDKIDTIVHMGACSATTEEDVDYLMSNNYRYTQLLAEWAVENNVQFIYASSAATYGDGGLGFSDNHQTLSQFSPINAYGYSKHLFDLYALRQDILDEITGIKFFNVFGPNEYHKGDMRSVICKAYKQIKETHCLCLFKSYLSDYSDGGQKRDFLYIKDCVDVMWWMMIHSEVKGIYNLGTGQARTWNDLGEAIFKAMGVPSNIKYIDMPENLKNQYQYFTEADMTKLQKAGYKNTFRTLEESVFDYVSAYLKEGSFLV